MGRTGRDKAAHPPAVHRTPALARCERLRRYRHCDAANLDVTFCRITWYAMHVACMPARRSQPACIRTHLNPVAEKQQLNYVYGAGALETAGYHRGTATEAPVVYTSVPPQTAHTPHAAQLVATAASGAAGTAQTTQSPHLSGQVPAPTAAVPTAVHVVNTVEELTAESSSALLHEV